MSRQPVAAASPACSLARGCKDRAIRISECASRSLATFRMNATRKHGNSGHAADHESQPGSAPSHCVPSLPILIPGRRVLRSSLNRSKGLSSSVMRRRCAGSLLNHGRGKARRCSQDVALGGCDRPIPKSIYRLPPLETSEPLGRTDEHLIWPRFSTLVLVANIEWLISLAWFQRIETATAPGQNVLADDLHLLRCRHGFRR